MNIAAYVTETLKQQGRSKKWLAEQTGIKSKTMYTKLDNDTLTAQELLTIGKLLDIDLNKLKEV